MPPPNPSNTSISEEVQVLLNHSGFVADKAAAPADPDVPIPLIEDTSVAAWIKPQWFDILLHMLIDNDVVLVGPAATGKSTAVVEAAKALKAELTRFSCSKNMDEATFLGKDHLRTESSGLESFFKDGPFVQAVRQARREFEQSVAENRAAMLHFFNIEEGNYLEAGITGFLNSFTDGWNAFLLETGEVLRRPPNFRILITMNDGYTGTRTQNEALYRSRFFVLECPQMPADTEKKVIAKRFPSLTKRQVDAFVLAAATIRGPRDKGEHDYDVDLRSIFQAVKLFDFLTYGKGKPGSAEAIVDACCITFMPKVGSVQSHGTLRSSMKTALKTNLTKLFPSLR